MNREILIDPLHAKQSKWMDPTASMLSFKYLTLPYQSQNRTSCAANSHCRIHPIQTSSSSAKNKRRWSAKPPGTARGRSTKIAQRTLWLTIYPTNPSTSSAISRTSTLSLFLSSARKRRVGARCPTRNQSFRILIVLCAVMEAVE